MLYQKEVVLHVRIHNSAVDIALTQTIHTFDSRAVIQLVEHSYTTFSFVLCMCVSAHKWCIKKSPQGMSGAKTHWS